MGLFVYLKNNFDLERYCFQIFPSNVVVGTFLNSKIVPPSCVDSLVSGMLIEVSF